MEYKGYTGIPFIDEESESLYGHVIGLRDVITFQGDTFAELAQSFRDSVDEYLDFCTSLGRSPEKPFSGRLLLRIPPDLHRKLANAAEASKMSLNALILEKLQSPPHKLAHAIVPEMLSKGVEQPEANLPRRRTRRILSPDEQAAVFTVEGTVLETRKKTTKDHSSKR